MCRCLRKQKFLMNMIGFEATNQCIKSKKKEF